MERLRFRDRLGLPGRPGTGNRQRTFRSARHATGKSRVALGPLTASNGAFNTTLFAVVVVVAAAYRLDASSAFGPVLDDHEGAAEHHPVFTGRPGQFNFRPGHRRLHLCRHRHATLRQRLHTR